MIDAQLESVWLDAARRGDQEAFGELVRIYEKRVFALTSRMCRNPDDAAEAAQDAFLAAWQGLPKFRGDSSFATWLYRLASNACVDLLRRENRRQADSLDEAALDPPSRNPPPRSPLNGKSSGNRWRTVCASFLPITALCWSCVKSISSVTTRLHRPFPWMWVPSNPVSIGAGNVFVRFCSKAGTFLRRLRLIYQRLREIKERRDVHERL